jgi:tetratricopeptide (TPR) repeat protein
LVYWYSLAHFWTGEERRAKQLLWRATDDAVATANQRLKHRILNLQGGVLLQEGKLAEAETQFQSLLATATTSEDLSFVAAAICNLAIIADIRMRWSEALALHKRALAAYITAGEPVWAALTHHNMGITCRNLSRYEEADGHFAHALEYSISRGMFEHVAYIELERALLISSMGDKRLAVATARRAFRRAQILGHRVNMAEAQRALGTIANSDARWSEAEQHLSRALEIAQDSYSSLLKAEVAEEMAITYRHLGEPELSTAALQRAVDAYLTIGAAERARYAKTRVQA